jgi:hypothetical protein
MGQAHQVVCQPHELDLPLTPFLQPPCGLEQVPKAHVLLDAVLVGHVPKILANLLSGGEELGPIGVVGKTVLKDVGRDITSNTWISVLGQWKRLLL